MYGTESDAGRRPITWFGAVLYAGLTLLCPGLSAVAAPTPDSGTLSETNLTVSWTGGSIAGANSDESTCQEDVTCEAFTLTLSPGDYTGERISIEINWMLQSNDYDFYAHEGGLGGNLATSSANGNTASERATIAIVPPVVTEPRVYAIHIVSFAVAPGDNYTGSAFFSPTPPPQNAIYLSGNLTFSPSVTPPAPRVPTCAEPSIRVDVKGNCYLGGIEGVPAGVDLWRFDLDPASPGFDPGLQNSAYLGQPDAFVQGELGDSAAGGADGGGDIDISVSFPDHPDSTPVVTITSLAVVNIASAVSHDRGDNFVLNGAVVATPADDRQWNESTGPSRVYLMWRAPIPFTPLYCARSDDHGNTYPLQRLVSTGGTTPGYLDVVHSTGTIHIAHQSVSALFCSNSTDEGNTWRTNTVDNTMTHRALFDVIKADNAGNLYGVWSTQQDIFMSISQDGGYGWSTPIRVNDNATYHTNIMPWIEAGDAGRIAVVWYGTTESGNVDGADWDVLFSQCLNALDAVPVFRQQVISDHKIHAGNVSLGGLTGAGNRNLLDYFQVAIDPQGAAVVAFSDDHCDYLGNTFATRQLDGASLYANANGNGMVDPIYPPPPPEPDPSEPEASDHLHDVVSGIVQQVPEDNPYDILWVDLSCEADSITGEPVLVATMKVSSLPTIPEAGNWRMNFAANAPGGLCDRGDHLWVRANSDNPAAPVYTYGTATRPSAGSFHTHTLRGTADGGSFDTANQTISVRVALSKLNQWVTQGPPIAEGSVLFGLRGESRQGTGNGVLWDVTRYGRPFTVGNCSTTGVEPGSQPPLATFLATPTPNPTSKASSVRFQVGRPGFVELAVFDVNGRRVRTIHAGNMATGDYVRIWDGRTDRWSTKAAPGVYFYILNTSSGTKSQKVTLLP